MRLLYIIPAAKCYSYCVAVTPDRRRRKTRERVYRQFAYRVVSNKAVFRGRVLDGLHADTAVDHRRTVCRLQ